MSALDKLKQAGSAGLGGFVGTLGSLSSLVGNDPQRDSVPAYTYGKDNKSYGKAYNAMSTPGHLIANAEQAVVSRIPGFGSKAVGNPKAKKMALIASNIQKLQPIAPYDPTLATVPGRAVNGLSQLGGDEPPIIQGGEGLAGAGLQGGSVMDVQDAQGTPSYIGRQLQGGGGLMGNLLQGANQAAPGNINLQVGPVAPQPNIQLQPAPLQAMGRTPGLMKFMPQVRAKKYAKATKI